MSKIKAICISEKKGTQKHPVDSANLVEDWGIEGDAHAGHWHRQVSLLSFEKVEAFRARGARVDFGAFGENLVVEGFDFRTLPVGTRFQCGGVLLEMTQIGKECRARRRERAPAGPSARRGGLRGGGGTSPSRRAGPHPD